MLNPKVYIRHLGGGSLDEPRFRQWLGEFRGLVLFYKKWFGRIAAAFVVFLIYIATLARVAAFTITGRWSQARTYAKIIANF